MFDVCCFYYVVEETYDPEGVVVLIFLVTFALCTCLVAKDVTYDKLSRMQVRAYSFGRLIKVDVHISDNVRIFAK